ncbi:MAG: type II toxin-antitoxin system VapC family toxin [Thermoflexales bacterium]|nr:type II toxin-antitoxin system VapC family toxin [Thermoflexales bacterium]
MPGDLTNPPLVFSFQDPPPEIAYLDPSFLLNVLVADATYHTECLEFARRLEEAGTTLLLSNLGLDEIWFVLLRLQAMREHGERGWLNFLRNHPERVRAYAGRLEEATLQILEIPGLLLVELTANHSLEALGLMSRYGLLPRDALHAAATLSLGVGAIITTDADFGQVEGLRIWTCHPNLLALQQ